MLKPYPRYTCQTGTDLSSGSPTPCERAAARSAFGTSSSLERIPSSPIGSQVAAKQELGWVVSQFLRNYRNLSWLDMPRVASADRKRYQRNEETGVRILAA